MLKKKEASVKKRKNVWLVLASSLYVCMLAELDANASWNLEYSGVGSKSWLIRKANVGCRLTWR